MSLQITAAPGNAVPPGPTPARSRNVVAFLDDNETAATLRTVCRDNATTPPRMQGGGLGAALEHHDLIGEVETILVDTDSSLMPTVDVAALRTVVPANVRVVTLGAADESRSETDLLAAGADRHLQKPVSAEALAAELFGDPDTDTDTDVGSDDDGAVAAAPRRATAELDIAPPRRGAADNENERPALPRSEAPTGAPRRIVVLGAHSGVGGTSLAVNLAALLARDSGEETLLLDLDLQFGTALLLLNRQPTTALGKMLREPRRIDRMMLRNAAQEAGKYLSVLGAEEALAPMAPLAEDAGKTLIREAGEAFHNVVVDLPAHRLELLAPCLAAATDVVLVSDFTLAGVRDVWRMQNEIQRHAPADARRHLVIGGAVDAGDKLMTESEFEHNTGMKIVARLPHDAAASGQASAAGKPVVLTKPRSRIGRAYAKFANELLSAKKKKGLRLFGMRVL
jgi:pilus assembly protein CpaE